MISKVKHHSLIKHCRIGGQQKMEADIYTQENNKFLSVVFAPTVAILETDLIFTTMWPHL